MRTVSSFLALAAGLTVLAATAPRTGPIPGQPGSGDPSGLRFPEGELARRSGPRRIVSSPAPEIPSDRLSPRRGPFGFVSSSRMLGSLGELTSIGKGRLFRTSGSSGEREAFSWLAEQLSRLEFLEASGASVTRHRFRLPLASEVRRVSLRLTVSGTEFEIPAYAMQGHRDVLALALRFDSDGIPNDDEPDPVVRSGAPAILQRTQDLNMLGPGSLRGRVALVDFALVDRAILGNTSAGQAATILLRAEPEALVLMTRYSNTRGVSHGSFLGDVSTFISLTAPSPVPTIFVKLEDLSSAGITGWPLMSRIGTAAVAWDADVFSPASSEYLEMRIPGADSSRAILLGAHLDSPNSPGALDDGSGVVALLEAVRSLEDARATPPVDVRVLWFGSHERGLYGSGAFTQANSELLDRAIAMLQIDCLTHPLDGLEAALVFEAQSYAGLGDARLPFPETLQRLAARHGVRLWVADVQGVASDNNSFAGYGVPNADTIYLSEAMSEVHVEGHLHDPYDDMPLAELHQAELSGMATTALTAIFDLPAEGSSYRVAVPPASRAVFVASHTEPVQMTPAHLSMLGMVLTWEGFDVDVVPYGSPVTQADLSSAGMVIVLPVVDYPNALAGPEGYDEGFAPGEVDVLKRYVEEGGLLVVANSATRLRYGTTPLESNEDWPDLSAVTSVFGITFENRFLTGTQAPTHGSHPVVAGVPALWLAAGNGVAIRAPGAETLARQGSDVAAALVSFGSRNGEVLALSDASILGGTTPSAPNFLFWRNLARHGMRRIATSGRLSTGNPK